MTPSADSPPPRRSSFGDEDFDIDGPADDGNPMGMLEHEITLAVDVDPVRVLKREAVMAHRSQVTDSSFFAQMPDEIFAVSFGTEWYIEKGVAAGDGPDDGVAVLTRILE